MSGAFAGMMITVFIFPVLLSLGVLIWSLWALGRLFPKLGLKAGEGWIPIFNFWRLLERGGFPGWISLTRVLFIALVIAWVSAVLADPYGATNSTLILGAAMQLSGLLILVSVVFEVIAMHRINVEAGVGAGYTVLAALLNPVWAMLLANHLGNRVLPGRGRGYAAPTAQAAGHPGAYGVAASAPGFSAPGSLSGGHSSAGYPTPGSASVPNPLAPPPTAGSQPAASPRYAPPPAGFPRAGAAQPWAADADLPTPPPLGSDTEAEYARLAAESFNQPPAVPLGQVKTPEPFSWTAASQPEAPPVPPLPAPAQPAPPAHPIAASVPPVAPVAPVPPVPSVPSVPATPPVQAAPIQPVPPARPVAPVSSVTGLTDSSPFAAPPQAESPQTVPAPAARQPTGITGMFDPLPNSAAPQTPHDDATEVVQAEDLDRTVVVPRAAAALGWVLQLADGAEIALERDSIVGRRPEAADGAGPVVIPDPTRTLSKSHARLRFDGVAWSIEDLNSTNGVVLLHADGTETELEAGKPAPATERMLLGTLEVQLRPGGDAA